MKISNSLFRSICTLTLMVASNMAHAMMASQYAEVDYERDVAHKHRAAMQQVSAEGMIQAESPKKVTWAVSSCQQKDLFVENRGPDYRYTVGITSGLFDGNLEFITKRKLEFPLSLGFESGPFFKIERIETDRGNDNDTFLVVRYMIDSKDFPPNWGVKSCVLSMFSQQPGTWKIGKGHSFFRIFPSSL